MCNLAFKEKLATLTEQLGKTLVAVLAGSHDRFVVTRWLQDSNEVPAEARRRIEFAHETFARVSAAEDPDIARCWCIGANVGEDQSSPIEAIREGRFDEVAISATRMIEGQWA